ncbi:MAG: hypothetical protein ACKVVT_14380 [Dehalococcoidia bacterium]
MDELAERCPDCATTVDAADNYCRSCGMYLAATRAPLPMVRPVRDLEPMRPGLPDPVRKAATALAVGAALQIGLGLTTRYLLKAGTQRAATAALMAAAKQPTSRAVTQAESAPLEAVSETVVVRRVWMRRG